MKSYLQPHKIIMRSKVGYLLICCDEFEKAVTEIRFIRDMHTIKKEKIPIVNAYNEIINKENVPTILKYTIIELIEYFEGKRKQFDIPIVLMIGTPFQKKVWKALLTIPYGETQSYKQIAEKIECPKGYRAVGNANNHNPISIIIPCHRVIGSNNKLIGYGGGLDKKKFLLELEQINIRI